MDDVVKTFHCAGPYNRKTFLEAWRLHGEQWFAYVKNLFRNEPDNMLLEFPIGAPTRFELKDPGRSRNSSSFKRISSIQSKYRKTKNTLLKEGKPRK